MDEPPTKLPPLHPAVCADSARDAEIKAAMAEVEALFAVGDVVFPQPPTDEMLRCWAAPFKKFNLDDREGPGTDSDYKVVDRTYVYTLSAAALERSASYCGRDEGE